MENILNNGFFWGILSLAFVIVAVFISNRPEKTKEKQTAQ